MSPLDIYYPTANEPKVHPLVRKSFVFVPSAGMRLAPEILVLEFMREVFFDEHFGDSQGTRDLDADELDEEHRHRYTPRQRAVLHALRGRRKKSRNAKAMRFFAPAYPQLAERAWLGKNRERVINNFLLAGPVSQDLWYRGPDSEEGKARQQEIAQRIWQALLGSQSCFDVDLHGKEFLAATLGPEAFASRTEPRLDNLVQKMTNPSCAMRIDRDQLASRITEDLLSICTLEAKIPRMQWIQLLMTFLRFALPMWLLAQMRITGYVHAWLLEAVDRGRIVDSEALIKKIAFRNRGLLHPTLTPTRELFDHVERYVKCRVELSVLLYCLGQVRQREIEGRALSLSGGGGDTISLENLLILARDASTEMRDLARFKEVASGMDTRTFLTREGEHFPAWRSPLMRGQGKNIDEFFRVMYRAEQGDEAGGYLLAPVGRGASRGFTVFPGQLLLKTMTYLAAQSKWSAQQRGGAGKLSLDDVEGHFGQYGVDFSLAADARPILMDELRAMGLLTGSPDAGSSAAVACPY